MHLFLADDRRLIEDHVARVVVSRAIVSIEFKRPSSQTTDESGEDEALPETITVPLLSRSRHPKREIIGDQRTAPNDPVGMRADTHQTLVTGIAKARAWARDLVEGRIGGVEEIARREGCSARHVRTTLPLAFVAPEIVMLIVANQVAGDFGISRLTDELPLSWKQQRHLLQS